MAEKRREGCAFCVRERDLFLFSLVIIPKFSRSDLEVISWPKVSQVCDATPVKVFSRIQLSDQAMKKWSEEIICEQIKVIKLILNSEEDNYQHRWIITYLLRDKTLEICLFHPKMLRKTLFLSFILSISVCHSQQNPNYRILPYSVNPVQYDRSPSISHKKEQDGFDLKQVNIHSLMKAIHNPFFQLQSMATLKLPTTTSLRN